MLMLLIIIQQYKNNLYHNGGSLNYQQQGIYIINFIKIEEEIKILSQASYDLF